MGIAGEFSRALIELALREDIGSGDITSEATIGAESESAAIILVKEPCVICGHEVAGYVFSSLDSEVRYEPLAFDGAKAESGEVVARLFGKTRSLLAGERIALNFLQRLSGIATTTARVVDKIKDSDVRVLDTRKTTPGWRELEKYAVTVGGGGNHRQGLFDAVLIKNNHIDALGGDIQAAIVACRKHAPQGTKIQVEVRGVEELLVAIKERPNGILLDNMTPEEVKAAVNLVRNAEGGQEIELEASGGITEENVLDYARSGVNSVSLGMLTHSVGSADIALRYG